MSARAIHQQHSAREEAKRNAGGECEHEEGQHRRNDVQQAEDEVAGRGQRAIVLGLVVPRHRVASVCALSRSAVLAELRNLAEENADRVKKQASM